MKKKALFCIENFQQGGINKALENLLSLYDREKLDIGLFVVNQENGPYKELFTPLLKYKSDSRLQAYCTYLSKHKGLEKYLLLGLKAYRKLLTKLGRDPFKKRLGKYAKKIEKDSYDCVIAFAEGYITEFVSHIKVHKAAWIHIDYKRYLDYMGSPNEKNIYESFDNIVIPSNFSAKSFEEVHPDLSDRIYVIPNALNTTEVKEKAQATADLDKRFNTSQFTIISIGRICYEKRFYEIPHIAKDLLDNGVNFKWYIIGDGSEAETSTLYNAIKEFGVENTVIPLGRKDNPYPYIARCDLLVSTSLSETFSYVVFEAKSLGVPVVVADFGTAPEILHENEGVISPICNIADTVSSLYHNKCRIEFLKNNLKDYHYNNELILNKLYYICD